MISNNEELQILKDKQAFFFDLDGTIYLENHLFNGVLELIETLKKQKKHFFFLSNNSSKSTQDYLKKLQGLNLNVTEDNIILSQHPTIKYLKDNKYQKIFLLGTTSLKQEFLKKGFRLTDKDPEILVLAFDQELTYEKLVKASYLLQDGIPYIATHPDDRCPTQKGYIPDAGGFISLLYKTVERKPQIFGKPNKEMLLFKLQQLDLPREKAVMFGDRLYTDIRMGIEAGITTCGVLSGETDQKTLKESDYQPDFVIEGLWTLLTIL
ncbi:MAG: HAD-IIA family hydrolase [Promethearchaeia archaeon]